MATVAVPPPVQDFFGVDLDAGGDVWASFVDGWTSFADWQVLLPLAVNVVLAILLVLPLVHGLRRLGYGYSVARVDEQESYLLLAVVSAAIAVLVLRHPAMALVVFGMGGLVRFRTPTGSAHGTGRAIFAVVVGLACGLSLYVSLLSMAKLNSARSRTFMESCSRIRIAQISFSFKGDF